jgi:hypothetical protein
MLVSLLGSSGLRLVRLEVERSRIDWQPKFLVFGFWL